MTPILHPIHQGCHLSAHIIVSIKKLIKKRYTRNKEESSTLIDECQKNATRKGQECQKSIHISIAEISLRKEVALGKKEAEVSSLPVYISLGIVC